MQKKTAALFKALFGLEDIRQVLRDRGGVELKEADQARLKEILTGVRKSLDELEAGGREQVGDVKIDGFDARCREEDFINIQPIQRGGVLSLSARKALIAYGDGYSVCDWCQKPFRLDKISKPGIDQFHLELAKFLNMDEARVMPGARRGFQAVVHSLVKPGDPVIVSSLGHYTEYLAIEAAGGKAWEVPVNEKNVITKDAAAAKIDEVKKKTGKLPALLMMDHFDYSLGNEHDVYGIGKITKKEGIPFLYNGAYTVGIMPVDGKKIGADFVVGSGHKSFASVAPSGILATTKEWTDKVFRTTAIRGDISGRTFGVKEVELLGCTLMGATVITMMASFPAVRERVKHWDEEVKKINYLVDELLQIPGTKVESELPRKHTFTKLDTTGSFDKVAKTHKKRGFYLTEGLQKRGIIGIFPGATQSIKFSTYGLSWDQVKHVALAFKEIAKENELL